MSIFACAVFLLGVKAQRGDAGVPNFCSGCDFSRGTLSNANFDGATYVGIDFDAADLHGASFRGARLVAINFNTADLEGAA
ncbi:MAG: pentapeptide repeat-containing protein, partial [Candidatus Eremiobacteraeota bacterium]|nr:pentapeptide repeat-containing protein [Candidatus Eremiobacteraeota bacterium]